MCSSDLVKTTRPCSVPRTARARTMAAPRTTRPVALTLRQDRRHLWQAKQATLHLRHNARVKKGAPRRSNSYPFPLPLSLSCNRDRERGYSERDPSPRRRVLLDSRLAKGLISQEAVGGESCVQIVIPDHRAAAGLKVETIPGANLKLGGLT